MGGIFVERSVTLYIPCKGSQSSSCFILEKTVRFSKDGEAKKTFFTEKTVLQFQDFL